MTTIIQEFDNIKKKTEEMGALMDNEYQDRDPEADPNCPYCEGEGKKMVQNGEDDFDLDVCDCVYK